MIKMGSKALLVRYANFLINNNKQCKNLLSSSAQCNKEVQHVQDKLKKEDEKAGYVTIECDQDSVGIVSGVPEKHIKTRTVLISQPTKNAMQSGTHNTHGWEISFDTRERWENPLMGWCSSSDPLQALRVHFQTKEEAIEHCERMGWKYMVQKANLVNPKPRSYGENFSWDKRTRVSTK